MSDVVTAVVERTTRSWREEAERRRQISKVDPVADSLEYCAGEIAERLRAVKDSSKQLTVEQFAKRENVTAQTVRNWIRADRIAAIETPKGYLISADQIAPLRRSA